MRGASGLALLLWVGASGFLACSAGGGALVTAPTVTTSTTTRRFSIGSGRTSCGRPTKASTTSARWKTIESVRPRVMTASSAQGRAGAGAAGSGSSASRATRENPAELTIPITSITEP